MSRLPQSVNGLVHGLVVNIHIQLLSAVAQRAWPSVTTAQRPHPLQMEGRNHCEGEPFPFDRIIFSSNNRGRSELYCHCDQNSIRPNSALKAAEATWRDFITSS